MMKVRKIINVTNGSEEIGFSKTGKTKSCQECL